MASSSFVYVALADLIPQLQKRLSARETAAQIAWLLVGIGLVRGGEHDWRIITSGPGASGAGAVLRASGFVRQAIAFLLS